MHSTPPVIAMSAAAHASHHWFILGAVNGLEKPGCHCYTRPLGQRPSEQAFPVACAMPLTMVCAVDGIILR